MFEMETIVKNKKTNQIGKISAVWNSTAGMVATVLWLTVGECIETFRTVEKLENLEIAEIYNGEDL